MKASPVRMFCFGALLTLPFCVGGFAALWMVRPVPKFQTVEIEVPTEPVHVEPVTASRPRTSSYATWTPRKPLSMPQGHSAMVLAFSPDGKTLAVGGGDVGFGSVRIWNVPRYSVRTILPQAGEVYGLSFAPDSSSLAIGVSGANHPSRLVVVEMPAGTPRFAVSGMSFLSVAYTPDGEQIVTPMTIRDSGDGSEVRKLTTGMAHVAISPDGKTAATDSTLIDVTTNRVTKLEPGPTDILPAFSPDGRMVATSSPGVLHDATTGRTIHTGIAPPGKVFAVAFAPDGSILATVGQDHHIRLWDLPACTEIHDIVHDDFAVWSLAFAPDGASFAAGDTSGKVEVWEAR